MRSNLYSTDYADERIVDIFGEMRPIGHKGKVSREIADKRAKLNVSPLRELYREVIMSTEQSLIQIRVDAQLKEQASDVFDKIGIDIPTAVRMFLKATLRDQKLPISTNVGRNGDPAKQQRETEQMMQIINDLLTYEPHILSKRKT